MQNELIEALKKLEAICSSNTDLQERKMQLAVCVEQFRLQGLYNRAHQEEERETAEGTAESEQARKYLEPLGLAPAGTPLPELCRLAALRLIKESG